MSNNRAELLKKSLMTFYKNKEHVDKISGVIEKDTDYSLRVIEWFCNNYSKKHDTIYTVNGIPFNVYLSYKSQLDSYQKKQFDPFKRKHAGFETFQLKTGKDKDAFILTTVGQLNFFRWCITNKVLEYVQKHIKEIKDDMIKYNTKTSGKTKNIPAPITNFTPPRKKRQPLSATRTCVKRYTKAVLEF